VPARFGRPSHTAPPPVLCANEQGLPKALYEYALRILPKAMGDPVAAACVCDAEKLTHRVLALAFTALQQAIAAIAPQNVTARREQRVMSWLVCSVTGVAVLSVPGQMAETAGARLLKAGRSACNELHELQLLETTHEMIADAEETIYPATGASALPWELATAPDEPAPEPAPTPVAAAPTLEVAPAPAEPAYMPPVLSHTLARELGVAGVAELAAFLDRVRPSLGKAADDGLVHAILPGAFEGLAVEVIELRRQIVQCKAHAELLTKRLGHERDVVITQEELIAAEKHVIAVYEGKIAGLESSLKMTLEALMGGSMSPTHGGVGTPESPLRQSDSD
jgi:hypothetical protein